MKKLHYSTGFKAAVVVVQQILSVMLVLSIIVISVLCSKNILNLKDMANKDYKSSGYFESQFADTVSDILNFTDLRRKFETEGSFNDEKIVDVRKYYNNQEIPDGIQDNIQMDKHGMEYQLGDLVEWSRGYTTSNYEFLSEFYLENGIHQKQSIYKNDDLILGEEKTISNLGEMTTELQEIIVKNVEHYYGGSYNIALQEGKIENASNIAQTTMDQTEAAITQETQARLEEIIQRVIEGRLYELSSEELELLLTDMGMKYNTSRTNYDFVDEEHLPLGGGGIWNNFLQGSISLNQVKKEYAALEYTLDNIGDEVNLYKKCLNRYNLGQDRSNISYWIKMDNKRTVYTNMSDVKETELTKIGKSQGKYFYYREADVRLETNVGGMEDTFYDTIDAKYGGKGKVLFLCVDTSFPNQDSFGEAKQEYGRMYPWIYISLLFAVTSGLGSLICLIYLSLAAGKTNEAPNQVKLNQFDHIPTEIVFAMFVLLGIGIPMSAVLIVPKFGSEELAGFLIISGVMTFFSTALILLFYLSFVRRIRAEVLWSNSMTYWILHGIHKVFSGRRPVTKMFVWFGLHLLGCMIIIPMLINSTNEWIVMGMVLFAGLSVLEGVIILSEGSQRTKVMDGIRSISNGDLEYKINSKELKGDNKILAESVNTIGDGLFHAVDASMKNERLKADLITNVSHDIKTPLTSIINYVDLLKREDIQNERIQNYIGVLDGKSQRLKQLTEDLVEASKVSSGNVTLEMERINLVELVYQTGGEFNEKFEAKGLTAITSLPKEPVVIIADGRKIWRVVENIYNNVAKYAMANTRVYVDMNAEEEMVHFSIKNISENALNIQADELTERFIRGDVSRSTEGSGLGLSIAKNLTALMGGEFEVYLDGDLFKVTISFHREKQIPEPMPEEM
ncbi:MAG: histidine kinase dimerization/phospho-acceptor domain-containing protein [Lachnospiraceae bacterium]